MLDRERILARIDELDGYLSELRQVAPQSFEAYKTIEKRRTCERLLQIAIECVIDICGSMVAGLRLGLPGDADDVFEKLERASTISTPLRQTLRRMKGLRNILVHEYGKIDDELVWDTVQHRLGDFESFKQEILQTIR